MNNKEKLLLSKLLEEVSQRYSNHGCNDMDMELFKDWTEEELKEFNRKMNVYNGDEDPSCEDYDDGSYTSDWFVFSYFSYLLDNEAKNE